MASGFTVQLIGFEEWKERINALPSRVQKACFRKALRSTAAKAKRRIKAATPRVSGATAGTVKVKVRVRGDTAYAVVKYTQRPAFTIRLREMGAPGHHQIARPFFAGAIAGMESQVQTEFLDALELALGIATIQEEALP